jgi:hypothetical protein
MPTFKDLLLVRLAVWTWNSILDAPSRYREQVGWDE